LEKASLVFGIDQCSLDYIGLIPAYPPPDVKCEFSNMVVQGGGTVATVLVALRRRGLSCHMAGMVGDDNFGVTLTSSLDEEGIDTDGILIRQNQFSQFAFIGSEPSVFSLYEAYESDETSAAHKKTAHYLKWRKTVEPWMSQPRKGITHTILAPVEKSAWNR
jgi:sugar/nucleoside kinase (ribokinase family)